ncbi:hypothetical protein ACW5X7_000713 [Morganella morganii]
MGIELISELQKLLHHHQSGLFKRYSKILMIRSDFHWSLNTDRYVKGDEHQFSADMSYLMLRLSDYPGVIGYAWVLEEALDRGLHVHAVIYVNGQRHCKKWGFQDVIETLWREVTDGEGYCYHCPDKKNYRHSIRHSVSFDDAKGREAMRYVVNYFAKTEQKPFEPIYHISRLPDANDKRVGRPRSRQH